MAGSGQKVKRDWIGYERELIARKARLCDFFFRKPTEAEIEKELNAMNRTKKGRKFEIPESILHFFHFLKHNFRIDDRLLALFLSRFLKSITGSEKEFDHSTIVKRRAGMELDVPFSITPEKLKGKRLYFDGMCLRVGRGGYYRSKRYGTKVKYLRIGLFTDSDGKVADFCVGEETDSEAAMIQEKMPLIRKSRAEAMVIDGAGSAKGIIIGLTCSGVRPIIRASDSVVKSMKNKPPQHLCIRKKKDDELIWENYAKAQQDYDHWKKETKYTQRWVYSEGKISSFKRMFGEEAVSRTRKGLHDEVCLKFMMLDNVLPALW